MSVTAKPLFTAQLALAAETTMYTASAGVRTIIDKFTGYNSTAAAVTVSVKLVPSGGTAATSNAIVSKVLAAGETYGFPELVGHTLESGGFISVLPSAVGVVVRSSGREVS